jgi:adenylate kinase family enzyme
LTLQPDLGRRICVVGTSGCGKTYVADALARILTIPYINNDAIIWRPNWQPAPPEERLASVDAMTRQESWTFDGNLGSQHSEELLILDRCDSIVWLDLPRWQIWSQVVRRTLARIVRRDELWHGNRESLRMMFSQDSIIWWSVKTFRKRREQYTALFADPRYEDRVRVRLGSRGEVDAWLASLSTESRQQLARRAEAEVRASEG